MFDDNLEFVMRIYFGLIVAAAFVAGALLTALVMWD
jgi:hypothetical protein